MLHAQVVFGEGAVVAGHRDRTRICCECGNPRAITTFLDVDVREAVRRSDLVLADGRSGGLDLPATASTGRGFSAEDDGVGHVRGTGEQAHSKDQ